MSERYARFDAEQSLPNFQKELEKAIDLKLNFPKLPIEEVSDASKGVSNEFDWTLGYTLQSEKEVEKKFYIIQLLKVISVLLLLEIRTHQQSRHDPSDPEHS